MSRTIAEIKKAGFRVGPALDAVSCTSVESSQPFWYYNSLKNWGPDNVIGLLRDLEPARVHGKGYRLLAAGEYTDEAVFPFCLLDRAAYDKLHKALDEICQAQRVVDEALGRLGAGKASLGVLLQTL